MIDENNEQRGIVETHEALRMARDSGLDLVEIAPQERPPVCRIMDFGKHKYLQKKKQKQQHTHETTLKEVRLRPKTDDNDRNIKMKRAEKFLGQGHRVQFTMLFRGRERQHRDLAQMQFQEITTFFAESAKLERPPKFEGRRMTMVLAPLKKSAPAKGGSGKAGSGKAGKGKSGSEKPASSPPTTREASSGGENAAAEAPASAPAPATQA